MTRIADVPVDGDSPLEWGLLAVAVAAVVFVLSVVTGVDPAMTLAALVGLGWLAVVFQIVVWTLEGYRDEREDGTNERERGGQEQASSTDGGTEANAGTDEN
ncbi:hypothetical protein [Natronoglomus mannanivorans]|uniref:Uncharacterized protein n=1 Tax=Natronoglomus mannanivorans TaxID=2979990 RepID=A0AAP2YY63_9EURY|nr:hypothetical protein [Halobacteria archaeon AArc-xg1-1]